MSGWTIALIAVLFGVGVLALLWWIIFNASRKAALAWKEEHPDEKVILYANGANCYSFPGEKFTLRGNGLLVLTPTDLHFNLWAPKKKLQVNLGAIEHVDTVKKFAGRRGRLPLLHVVFRMPDGEMLETAFAVGNAKYWVDVIRSGIHNGGIIRTKEGSGNGATN